MNLRDDGDIIRGLGFVALYAAYLEEATDECVAALAKADSALDQRLPKWPASRKIEYCEKQLEGLRSKEGEIERLRSALQACSELLEWRNDVLHGRIYAKYGEPDVRKSGRAGVPDREIASGELYELAQHLFDACGPLIRTLNT